MPTPATNLYTKYKKVRCSTLTQDSSSQEKCPILTLSAEDSPARVFLTLANDADLKMQEALCSLKLQSG